MTDDLINCLRQDAEMLKDGHQKNLTKLWCDVAALDVIRAARRIEALEVALRNIEYEDTLISYDGKDREYGSCAEMARAALDKDTRK
jgi:hypothetical protein